MAEVTKVEKKQVNCFVPVDAVDYLDAYAARFGVSRGSAIALLVAKVREQELAVNSIGKAVELCGDSTR